MKTKLLFITLLGFSFSIINAQNLLDISTWTISSGSVGDFSRKGRTSENSRELGKNHVGEEVILWKAVPNNDGRNSGGWRTSNKPIDPSKTHRFTVWMKKTNSNDGVSYFGFYTNKKSSLTLSGLNIKNPYFWVGDLPKLNRWYLIVGYVHKSNYSSSINLGRIYDGVTGAAVRTITDFKFKSTAATAQHRSFLYNDSNTSDRQYFYAPRIDPITGTEPSLQELLSIHNNSKLLIHYDTAGNQKEVLYCSDAACSPSFNREETPEAAVVAARGTFDDEIEETTSESENSLLYGLHIYPNPTNGNITLQIPEPLKTNIHNITLYNTLGSMVKKVSLTTRNTISVDISDKPMGVYFVHIHLKEGESITKRIIKN